MTGIAWIIPPLTLLCGWLLWTRLPPAQGEQEDPLERTFAAALAGLLVTGCIGLALAEFSAFTPPVLIGVLAGVAIVLLVLPARRVPTVPAARRDLAGFVIVLLLAVFTLAPASEEITGGRDEGVYANIGAWLAQHGTIRMRSEALASLTPDARPVFQGRTLLPGFYVGDASQGEIFPQFLHLHPVYLAIGFWLGGITGLVHVPPVYGVMSLLGLFLLVRRLLGAGPAVASALVLGLNLAQIWVLRTPFSEGAAQLTFVAVLWCLVKAAQTEGVRWGVLGGIAMGAGFQARVDAVVLLPGLLPALAFMHASASRSTRWLPAFLLTSLGLAAWSVWHGWLFARTYYAAMQRYMVPVWLLAGVLIVLWAVFIALGRVRRTAIVEAVHRRGRIWWAVAAVLIAGAFVFGLWIRPELRPWMARGRPLYVEQSMVRVAWYLSTAGMVAACAGLLLALRQWLVGRRAEWLPFLGVVLTMSAVYFWNPRVHIDHPWAMRRFVPVVLPGLAVAIAVAAAWLWEARARWRLPARTAAAIVLGWILIHEARLVLPFSNAPERAGAIEGLAAIARHVPAGSILLYTAGIETWVATPLACFWGSDPLPILRRTRTDPDGEQGRAAFEAQVLRWLDQGRLVLYLTRNEAHTPYLADRIAWDPIETFRFKTYGASQNYEGPPRRPRIRDDPFHLFRLGPSRTEPPACAGLSLDARGPVAGRTQGFHPVEPGRRGAFRWTEPVSRVRFGACDARGAARPAALRVRAMCNRARAGAPCAVKVSVNSVPAGALALRARWDDHVLTIPDAALTGGAAPIDVRFIGPSFTPSNRRERRQLSFQVREVALQGAPALANPGTNGS
jgi:FtsH-binding integral membrane protein